MASWLSSKLKAAEQLLNQIDQQAADSLGKPENDWKRNVEAPSSHFESYSPDPEQHAAFSSSNHENSHFPASSSFVAAPRPQRQVRGMSSSGSGENDDWTQILAASNAENWKAGNKPTPSYAKSTRAGIEKKPGSRKSKSQTKKAFINTPKQRPSSNESGEAQPAAVVQTTETRDCDKQLVEDCSSKQREEDSNNAERQVTASKSTLDHVTVVKAALQEMDVQRREIFLACEAAVKEREAFVEKLEMEKDGLERLLAEREEKQKQEAAELTTSMAELLQAAELEKQRHSHTRMDALTREASLQNESVELAKALAAAQRKLDSQLSGLVDLRTKVEVKWVSVAELERRVSKLQSHLTDPPKTQEKHYNRPYSSLSEEKQNIVYEIDYYKTQLKALQEEIVSSRLSQHTQSDREIELESRLVHLTDHLIQKQTQVEALSTEKATLIFRLETLSASQERTLKSRDDNLDLEFGTSTNKDKPVPELISRWYMEISSKLDTIFIQGARILGMNRTARATAAGYFLLLHVWVLFVVVQRVLT